MKTIVSLSSALLLVAAVSCSPAKKEPVQQPETEVAAVQQEPSAVPVEYKEVSGYFLSNKYKLEDEVTLILIQNKDQLDLNFGMAKTMTNKIDQVDFDKDAVFAIAMHQTNFNTKIEIEKVEKVGETLAIYAKVNQGEKQSYSIRPLALFSFPKDTGTKQAQLYVGEEKKTFLPL